MSSLNFKKISLEGTENQGKKQLHLLRKTSLNYLTVILELTAEITLKTVFWNLFMMTLQKYLTLKISQQFLVVIHLETFFTCTVKGKDNSDI